jgi:hypothetical protein
MKRGAFLSLCALLAAALLVPVASGAREPVELKPGTERWAIKTAADPEARTISRTPVETSVEELVALSRPDAAGAEKRLAPVETSLYTLEVEIARYELTEEGDVRLEIRGASGKSMLAFIPLPRFVERSSPWASRIEYARRYFEARFTPELGERKSARNLAQLTGVGFFGAAGGKRGAAENGIELHPVVRIQWLKRPKPPKSK